jgi:membrane-associated phospholipid phosphatase
MDALRRNRRAWLVAAFALIALVFVLRLYLSWVGPFPGDRSALQRAIDYHAPGPLLEQVTELCASVGSALTAVLTLFVAGFTLQRSDGTRGVAGLLMAFAVVVVNAILKALLSPTPLWAQYFHGNGGNFPSGHVVYASAVLGYLAVMGWRHRRLEITTVCALLIVAMGPARVADGSHLVSDAIGGYLLGFGWLILVLLVVDRTPAPRRRVRQPSAGSSSSASPPLAARSSSE